jgi:hypothetical protein
VCRCRTHEPNLCFDHRTDFGNGARRLARGQTRRRFFLRHHRRDRAAVRKQHQVVAAVVVEVDAHRTGQFAFRQQRYRRPAHAVRRGIGVQRHVRAQEQDLSPPIAVEIAGCDAARDGIDVLRLETHRDLTDAARGWPRRQLQGRERGIVGRRETGGIEPAGFRFRALRRGFLAEIAVEIHQRALNTRRGGIRRGGGFERLDGARHCFLARDALLLRMPSTGCRLLQQRAGAFVPGDSEPVGRWRASVIGIERPRPGAFGGFVLASAPLHQTEIRPRDRVVGIVGHVGEQARGAPQLAVFEVGARPHGRFVARFR